MSFEFRQEVRERLNSIEEKIDTIAEKVMLIESVIQQYWTDFTENKGKFDVTKKEE